MGAGVHEWYCKHDKLDSEMRVDTATPSLPLAGLSVASLRGNGLRRRAASCGTRQIAHAACETAVDTRACCGRRGETPRVCHHYRSEAAEGFRAQISNNYVPPDPRQRVVPES